MVTFTRPNRISQDTNRLNRIVVLQALKAIQRSWTAEETLQRAALAEQQTLKLVELILGTSSASSNC